MPESFKCFFCKKDIKEKDTDDYVILKIKDIRIVSHKHHNGVMEEYDRQIGFKKPLKKGE